MRKGAAAFRKSCTSAVGKMTDCHWNLIWQQMIGVCSRAFGQEGFSLGVFRQPKKCVTLFFPPRQSFSV